MYPVRVYRCLACGSDITEETTYSHEGLKYQATSELRHVEPMDAACRLLFEVLTDELAAVQRRMINNVRADLGLR